MNIKSLKGISMIILILTIVIMLILVSTVALTIKNQDSIEKTKEAVLRDHINALKADLNAYVDNKRFEAISRGEFYSPENDTTLRDIQDYNTLSVILPSMDKSYEGIFCIKDGQITYIGSDNSSRTIRILIDMGVNYDEELYPLDED